MHGKNNNSKLSEKLSAAENLIFSNEVYLKKIEQSYSNSLNSDLLHSCGKNKNKVCDSSKFNFNTNVKIHY